MRITVDRIENEMVVCENENREQLTLPLSNFDYTVKDGDICEYENGVVIFLEVETAKKKELLQNKFNRLKKYSETK